MSLRCRWPRDARDRSLLTAAGLAASDLRPRCWTRALLGSRSHLCHLREKKMKKELRDQPEVESGTSRPLDEHHAN